MSNKRPVVVVHRPTGASGVSMREAGIENGYQGTNHYAVEVGHPGNIIRFDLTVRADRKTTELRVIPNARASGFTPLKHPFITDLAKGTTSLSDKELEQIGNRLIAEHATAGKYTKIWNNCQIWALLFFRDISNEQQHWMTDTISIGYKLMQWFM
ncbi:hypothetical protein VE00_03491 [Pseudogymnoascus sp. WSF 3629]|nr:hypothetical protein VE00_03491 [Pseudogymnoascus sp. WSF 3629]